MASPVEDLIDAINDDDAHAGRGARDRRPQPGIVA